MQRIREAFAAIEAEAQLEALADALGVSLGGLEALVEVEAEALGLTALEEATDAVTAAELAEAIAGFRDRLRVTSRPEGAAGVRDGDSS